MYEKSFQLVILTLDQTLFEGPITSLVAPGKLGPFGVLAGHAKMVCALEKGEVRFRRPSGEVERIPIFGGFCRVASNKVTLLAERAPTGVPAG